VFDTFLNTLRKNAGNILIILFSFVSALYLSQASLARTIMGYGGIIFFLLWVFIKFPFIELNRET
jgi:hypothetical protein